jgi:hypothetical protein
MDPPDTDPGRKITAFSEANRKNHEIGVDDVDENSNGQLCESTAVF